MRLTHFFATFASLNLLAIGCAVSQLATISVPLREDGDYFSVVVEFQGNGAALPQHRLRLLLSESSSKSVVTVDALKRLEGEKSGFLPLFGENFSPEIVPDLAPFGKDIDGILGADVLNNLALGFDLESLELTVLRGGHVTDKAVREWFAALADWPALGTHRRSPKAMPLSHGPETFFTLPLRGGSRGQNLNLLVTTARRGTAVVAEEFSGNEVALSETNLAGRGFSLLWGLSLGGDPFHWIPATTVDSFRIPGSEILLGGRLALSSFFSRRVLLDFPAHKLYIEDLPQHARASLALSSLLSVPLYLQSGHLHIGHWSPSWPTYAGAENLQDYEVDNIAGISALEIAESAEHPSARAASVIAKLWKARAGPVKIAVSTPAGKFDFTVPPPNSEPNL